MKRMSSKPRMLALLFLVCISMAVAPSRAHGQVTYTVSPFVGVRFGGRVDINAPAVDYLPIDSSVNWGFNFGRRIVPNLFGEFMFNRQTTTLSAHDIPSNHTTILTNNAHLDMYQVSLLYEIPMRSKLWPFVVAGIGFTHFDSHGILSFGNRFSYNIGGGVDIGSLRR